jgi:hypothetical protein
MREEDDTRFDEPEDVPGEDAPLLPPPDYIALPMTPWGPMLPMNRPQEDEPEEEEVEEEDLDRLRDEAAAYLSMN